MGDAASMVVPTMQLPRPGGRRLDDLIPRIVDEMLAVDR